VLRSRPSRKMTGLNSRPLSPSKLSSHESVELHKGGIESLLQLEASLKNSSSFDSVARRRRLEDCGAKSGDLRFFRDLKETGEHNGGVDLILYGALFRLLKGKFFLLIETFKIFDSLFSGAGSFKSNAIGPERSGEGTGARLYHLFLTKEFFWGGIS